MKEYEETKETTKKPQSSQRELKNSLCSLLVNF